MIPRTPQIYAVPCRAPESLNATNSPSQKSPLEVAFSTSNGCVGKLVGCADGELVSLTDGSNVGESVCNTEGVRVGARDGAIVGFFVGDFVGKAEGCLVGAFVGDFVGSSVGNLVGLCVGF